MAAAALPPGYARSALTLVNVENPSRSAVITCGFQRLGTATAANIDGQWRTLLTQGALAPYAANHMDTSWSVTQSYTLLNVAGVLSSWTDGNIIAGTASVPCPPMGTPYLVRKTTPFAGRTARGRVFAPVTDVDEADINAGGFIVGSEVTRLQTYWSAVNTGLQTNSSCRPTLIHDNPLLTPTNVIQFTVQTQCATRRRRLRR